MPNIDWIISTMHFGAIVVVIVW